MTVDDDVTQAAPADAPLPTTELGPAPDMGTPLAYSVDTASAPVIDYRPSRSRTWVRVAALVAAILVVTGGAAAAILWLGHHPTTAPPVIEAAEPSPTVTPGPFNGVYRLSWNDAQAINRMPDGSVEPVTADMGASDLWFAIRSRCEQDECTATLVQVDGDSHGQSDLTKGIYTMRLVNGQWHTARPEVGRATCVTKSGEDIWETAYSLTQLPDGALTGHETQTVTTNVCGIVGMVRTTPMSGTRVGDVPSTVTWNEKE